MSTGCTCQHFYVFLVTSFDFTLWKLDVYFITILSRWPFGFVCVWGNGLNINSISSNNEIIEFLASGFRLCYVFLLYLNLHNYWVLIRIVGFMVVKEGLINCADLGLIILIYSRTYYCVLWQIKNSTMCLEY